MVIRPIGQPRSVWKKAAFDGSLSEMAGQQEMAKEMQMLDHSSKNPVARSPSEHIRAEAFKPALAAYRLFHLWQSRVGKLGDVSLVTVGHAIISTGLESGLLGFVEDAIHALFAARRKPMQLCKRQFFLELEDTLRKGGTLRQVAKRYQRFQALG